MNHCGEKFHNEVAKFRFLNELIKVLSPKVSIWIWPVHCVTPVPHLQTYVTWQRRGRPILGQNLPICWDQRPFIQKLSLVSIWKGQ